jgi:proteasome lid subunit RPN8/RPN11
MSEEKKVLILTRDADLIMRRDALDVFPNECCGFMYGYETEAERIITLAVPVLNSKEGDQRRRFEISPFDYMKAESIALKQNLTLLGVYHSHPQHPAIASETDLKSAMPFFSYVIYSVLDGKIADVKSWKLNDKNENFYEEEVVLKAMHPNVGTDAG